MNIKEALDILMSKIDGMEPVGYWKRDDAIIVNLRPLSFIDEYNCSFFTVYSTGEVVPTNPVLSNLAKNDMIRIDKKVKQ